MEAADLDLLEGSEKVQPVEVLDLGIIEHSEADVMMREMQTKRLAEEILDTLLICEHPEVVTVGPRARNDGITPPLDYASTPVDRGGGLTWHGPGQIVVYPIFHWLDETSVQEVINKIEHWIICALNEVGIDGGRDSRMQGVWVEGHKIASIGLSFLKWVSRHGFTINLDTPPGRVELLAGCGLEESTTTSLSRLGYEANRKQIITSLLETMPRVLKRVLKTPQPSA